MRAAPSFHSRSRAMISSSASAAASRSPAAIRAWAMAKRASWSSGLAASRASSADTSAAGAAAHFERRPRPADRRVLGLLLGQRVEQRSRLVGLAAGDQRPGQAADRPPDCRGPSRGSGGRSTRRARASPSPSTCSPIAISGSISAARSCAFALDRQLGEQLVEDSLQLRLGAVIGEVGDRLALEDRIDRRDRLDLELGGDELVARRRRSWPA